MEEVLITISFIIAISAIAAVIARLIKQPPLIAYLIAGVLCGPLFLNIIDISASDTMQTFAHIGVAFLLFIVGLNLDIRVLKEVGKVSFIVGFTQIIFTILLGYFVAIILGLSNIIGIYLGLVLAFSSTIVVVKMFSDKKEIDTLHGRVALGILILQDFVAALALMAVPLLNNQFDSSKLFVNFGMILGFIIFIFIFSHFLLNKFLNFLARSQETLFLFGIAWALVLSSLFYKFGFSLEIGALIAGMSIASSRYNLELGGKIKPLRDFFVVLFFVYFGSQLAGEINLRLVTLAIIFSLVILLGKPLIIMTALRFSGYKKKTNFLIASSLAQISEFSLILVLVGYKLGHLSSEIVSLTILIAIITIGISSYSIYYSHLLFSKISHLLNIFEGKKYHDLKIKKQDYEIILFGYHRIGYKILHELKILRIPFLVVDYNPKVVIALAKQGVNCIFGDAGDEGFLNELELHKTKVIISTIPDKDVNIVIKEKLKKVHSNAAFIATAEQSVNALDLYKEGADYVIIPHHLGGEYAADMIKKFHIDRSRYKEQGRKHIQELKKGKNNSIF